MEVERLHLEVTRNCTLDCEHCLRGEKEKINMDVEILDYIFHDVTRVNKLLLTGGEPLLAINVIEKLIEIMKLGIVKVDSVEIITNGTIFSERILKYLLEIKDLTDLDFRISFDIFHKISLKSRNLLERRTENLEKMTDYLTFKEHGTDRIEMISKGLIPKGRALTLTQKRLDEINALIGSKYVILNDYEEPQITRYIPFIDKVVGVVTIDVKGRLVPYSLSYQEEDDFVKNNEIDIRQIGFKDAIIQYTNVDRGLRKILWI